MTTTKFRQTKDINGYPYLYSLPYSNTIYSFKLTVNVEETITVPSDLTHYVLAFNFDSRVFIAVNTTATIPLGAPTLSGSILNPNFLEVRAGDVIHIVSPDDGTNGTISIYGLLNA